MAKVKGFLDLSGAWDPSLALVMGGAIAVGAVAFAVAKRRTASWTGAYIEMPSSTLIDRRLIAGGVLSGGGWGIAGLCPGPALVFVGAMLAGMVLHDRLLTRRTP